MDQQIKPSWKTGEFWAGTVLPQIPGLLSIFLGAANPLAIGLGALAAIVGNIVRTKHKTELGKAAILAGIQAAAQTAQEVGQVAGGTHTP